MFGKRLWVFVVVGAVVLATGVVAAPRTYRVDPVHSSATFRIKHFGVSFVTGSFSGLTGTVVHDPDDPAACSVDVTVPTTTVDTANAARDRHLRSADYFDVERYPTMRFVGQGARMPAKGLYRAVGDLTLRGTTRQVPVLVRFVGEGTTPKGERRAGGTAAFSIRRSDFGMTTSLGPIGDVVDVTVDLQGVHDEASR